MIGYYSYTVILTYISLASAMAGMFFACGMIGGTPQPTYAIVCLMLSGLCDMFDGKIARTKKNRTENEKKFGIQIDSLCDVICFGVLPSIIGYSVGLDTFIDLPVLIIFPLCAVIRLAYFNVMEEERQKKTDSLRKSYEGLPVTSVALIFPLVYSFRNDIGKVFPQVYGSMMLLVAIAFITRFKVKKPGMKTMLAFIGVGFLEFLWLIYKTKLSK